MNETLLRRCRTGDRDALAELFEAYQRLVYKTAFLMLGDVDQADDALQEVFLKAFAAIHSYDPRRGAISTWLYRITMNYCLNLRRSRPERMVSLEQTPTSDAARSTPGPETLLADEDLLQAIGRLSDRLRAVVVLRFYADLSLNEIATALSIPTGTVKSRLAAALKTLRFELAGDPRADAIARPQLFGEVTQ